MCVLRFCIYISMCIYITCEGIHVSVYMSVLHMSVYMGYGYLHSLNILCTIYICVCKCIELCVYMGLCVMHMHR